MIEPRTSARGRPGVLAVTLGIFTVVTDGTAGLTMFLPGLLAAVAAPLVTVAARRADRRRVLLVLVALLVAANALAALTPGYGALLVSRVLLGVVIGGFWAVAVALAPRRASSRRATSSAPR